MKEIKYIFIVILLVGLAGCGGRNNETGQEQSTTSIIQKEDGSIILELEKAFLWQDSLNPYMNTAEWSLNITNRGRYELWITSFTKDTMDLKYDSPVTVTFGDKRIRKTPVGNEIVLDSPAVKSDYYRADSKIGSVYIDRPGHYNIQVVSSKVLASDLNVNGKGRHTLMKSLIIKPMTE